MKVPAVFHEFALNGQDTKETGKDLDETVKSAVKRLSTAQRAELTEFLTQLLGGHYSDDQLRDLWRYSSSGFIILEGIRDFLGEVVKLLRAKS